MCQNWSSCTPTTLHEWYHFDQGTPVNDINDVTRKKLGRDMGFGHFSKLHGATKSNLDNISSSNLHASKNIFMTKSRCLYCKPNYICQHSIKIIQWHSNEDRYGYKRYLCVSELLFYAVILQKYVLISYDGNLAGPLSRGTEVMHS